MSFWSEAIESLKDESYSSFAPFLFEKIGAKEKAPQKKNAARKVSRSAERDKHLSREKACLTPKSFHGVTLNIVHLNTPINPNL